MKLSISRTRAVPPMLLAGALLAFADAVSQGALITFTDRPTWLAAVGPLSFVEDFQSYAADVSFQTASFGAQGFSIQQEGTNQNFRNQLDVVPLGFSDFNGTNSLSLFTNSEEPGTPATTVRLTFGASNTAFGGESFQSGALEGAVVDIYNGATLLGSIAISNTLGGSFLGYRLTGGDIATSLVFRSSSLAPGGGGEGFGFDNIAGVNAAVIVAAPVPEPTTALFGAALLGMVGLSRRRSGAAAQV